MMAVDGFTFYHNKNGNDVIYWSCDQKNVRDCRATLITNLGNEVIRKGTKEHNHPPSALRKPLANAYSALKVFILRMFPFYNVFLIDCH
jgi:FLYWCH zinc finger domain